MLHMVIFRGAEGKPGYHQTDELDAAVAFVERLRNDDGVTDIRVFRMEEVSIEFRPYFRVEVVGHERKHRGGRGAGDGGRSPTRPRSQRRRLSPTSHRRRRPRASPSSAATARRERSAGGCWLP